MQNYIDHRCNLKNSFKIFLFIIISMLPSQELNLTFNSFCIGKNKNNTITFKTSFRTQ